MRCSFYDVLAINQSATVQEINKAYRKLSLKHHPYKNSNSDESTAIFLQIAEAYDVLSNAKTRKIYDLYGEEDLKRGVPFKDESGQGWYDGYVFHNDPYTVFQEFFGGDNPFQEFYDNVNRDRNYNFCNIRALKPKKKETDVVRNIMLTLEELYYGCVKKMKISRRVLNEDGHTSSVRDKILNINIGKGWPENTSVIFKNESDQGPNSIPADIIFNVQVSPHPIFFRVKDDLFYHADITLSEALTGIILNFETLDKRILSIPINHIITPTYEKVIKGEGMPIYNKTSTQDLKHGDLTIKFNIIFPKKLSQEKKDLIKLALKQ